MDAVDLILNLQEQEERNKCRKDNSGQLVYRQSVDTCVTFTREELFGWEKGEGWYGTGTPSWGPGSPHIGIIPMKKIRLKGPKFIKSKINTNGSHINEACMRWTGVSCFDAPVTVDLVEIWNVSQMCWRNQTKCTGGPFNCILFWFRLCF